MPDQPVDHRARADRPHQDQECRPPGQGVQQPWCDAADPLHVRHEVTGRADHGGVVRRVHEHVRGGAVAEQREVRPGRGGGFGGGGGEYGGGEQGGGADGCHSA
ncbi:hypothetical protein [Streptomyces afghaniensis]|uniref:hypothetical protein n=1 Tax=Streptomyces afghaniensis TaxID=66865 RepID=UPI002468B771|nr:hypothetical protein [Streptomyces afghaniensis]